MGSERGGQIRVARVIDRLNVGGPAHHVLLLTQSLRERGYQPLLVKGHVAPGEAEMADVIHETGVVPLEVEGLGRAVSPAQDLRAFLSLRRVLRRVRPQVVHTHKSKAGVLGRLAAWSVGVPVVVHTFHGHIFHGYFAAWKSWLIVAAERLLARRTQAVVAVSRRQRVELLQYRIASRARICAIPLGLRLSPFASRDRSDDGLREELGFERDAPLVGMVTRLVPIKGVSIFLHSACRVAQRAPEARFVVVGDGELRKELERCALELGLSDRVRFVGFRRDTPRIYAALNVTVLSSYNEGLPVTLIEALASGCYVVATTVGGVKDLVTDERLGLTVPPGDTEALADAIVEALAARREVCDADRQEAASRYGIGRLTADIDRLYRGLLRKETATSTGANLPRGCWEGTNA